MLGGMSLPTIKEIHRLEKSISDACIRKLNDNDINFIIKEKQKFMLNPRNYAMHKSKLIKERDDALQAGNEEKTEELNQKLLNLEERAEELDRARTSKIGSIALINDKNRKRNIMRAEQGIRMEIQKKKEEGEVDDPFTRRKTRPMKATSVLKKEDNEPPTEKITSQWLADQALKQKEKEDNNSSPANQSKADNPLDEKKENKPEEP